MSLMLSEESWSEPVGFVGDYCVVCDEPSAFVLIAHKRRTRLNGIGLPASVAGHEIMCTTCSTPYQRKRRKHGYAAVLEEPAAPHDMITQTTPDYADRHRARMDLLKMAAAGGSVQERVQLYTEIFRDLRYTWARAPRLDGKRLSIGFLLSLGGVLAAILASMLLLHAGPATAVAGFVCSGVLLAAALMYSRFERIRLARAIILPRLGMALRHLSPTEDEIDIARRRAARRLRALRYLTVTEICATAQTAIELDDAAPAGSIEPPPALAV